MFEFELFDVLGGDAGDGLDGVRVDECDFLEFGEVEGGGQFLDFGEFVGEAKEEVGEF